MFPIENSKEIPILGKMNTFLSIFCSKLIPNMKIGYQIENLLGLWPSKVRGMVLRVGAFHGLVGQNEANIGDSIEKAGPI